MVYIGITDPENDPTMGDVMAMHVEMLCHWLAGLDEIPEHHRSLPWRSVVCVNERRFQSFLRSLEMEWKLVLKIDRLNPRSSLYKQMAHTRWQSVREIFIEAECLVCICFEGPGLDLGHSAVSHVRHHKGQ